MAGASLEFRQAFPAIRDVLLHEWDPIGIGDEPRAQDEYDAYIPSIYYLLTDGTDDDEIALHLDQLVTVGMGLSSSGVCNQAIVKRLRQVIEAASSH